VIKIALLLNETDQTNIDSLLSVGIDIGTTSTHLTISRLHLGNLSCLNQTPHLAIESKEIVYQSQIYFTPLTLEGVIDAEGVAQILAREYAKAGVSARDIQTGAVIITGESAKLRNASEVVQAITMLAGEFVVESAGAHLESILAGRGSGAARASKEQNKTIANVDIGGGTTNIAIFAEGEPIQTACIGIGGRFMSFDDGGAIQSITASGRNFLDYCQLSWPTKGRPEPQELDAIASVLAHLLIEMIAEQRTELPLLWSTSALRSCLVDEYWFSGGVAELMLAESEDNMLVFADMGVYLARALVTELKQRDIAFVIPSQPIRATVIGAGLYTLQLTGSTVGICEPANAIRNLRIVRPSNQNGNGLSLTAAIVRALDQQSVSWSEKPLALVLGRIDDCSFAALKQMAEEIAELFVHLRGAEPLVILTTNDVAMALAQFFKKLLPSKKVIVLDGIVAGEGDFIDIGTAIEKSPGADTATVPVVIKSLIFR
jgi:ethanolamine utilization protein EutA